MKKVIDSKEMSEYESQKRYWIGEVGTVDQDTGDTLDDFGYPIRMVFVDGRTTQGGRWAIMNPQSHTNYGVGLGTGRGQKYIKQKDGRWLKTEG